MLDRIYPKLKIDLVMVQGDFSPSLVDQLSLHFHVPKNFMFIACPGDHFPYPSPALPEYSSAFFTTRTHLSPTPLPAHARVCMRQWSHGSCAVRSHDIAALGGVRLITY